MTLVAMTTQTASEMGVQEQVTAWRHVCGTCHRGFSRREHLLRHERIHTNEAPFACDTCGQRFKRQDVFRRHHKGPCSSGQQTEPRGKLRSFRACNHCRSQKLKCDGGMPCQRCIGKSQSCVYDPPVPSRQTAPLPGKPAHYESAENDQMTPPLSAAPGPVTGPHQLSHWELQGSLSHLGQGLAIAQDNENLLSSVAPTEGQPTNSVTGHVDVASHSQFTNLQTAETPRNPMHLHALLATAADRHDLDLEATPQEQRYEAFYPFSLDCHTDDDFDRFQFLPGYFGDLEFPLVEEMEMTTPQNRLAAHDGRGRDRQGDLPTWAYHIPLTIQQHDTEIVQSFLDLFWENLSHVFPTFARIKISKNTSPDLVLAMAAVGGLYSKTEGSFRIAISMYTDARRLAASRVWSFEAMSPSQSVDLIRAHMCIETFGLCSGDARTLECAEACHKHLIQICEDAGILNIDYRQSSDQIQERIELLVSLYTLESYHVVLLQRAPCIYGPSVQSNGVDPRHSSSTLHRLMPHDNIFDLLHAALNPHVTKPPSATHMSTSFCLASLSALSSHARRHAQRRLGGSSLWRREHVELSLHRWYDATQISETHKDFSLSVMCHITWISLYADMDLTHKLVSAKLEASEHTSDYLAKLEEWQRSSDGRVVIGYASSLLEDAKQALIIRLQHNTSGDILQEGGPPVERGATAEAPHFAPSIYLASLLLWISCITAHTTPRKSGNTHLQDGIYLLSHLKSRMARRLCRTLIRLLTTEG